MPSPEPPWELLGLSWVPRGLTVIAPSVKGDWANRSGLGDFERSIRLLAGRGGIRGVELAAARSLAGLLDGRGGMIGCCIVGAVIVCKSFKEVDIKA